MDAERAGEETPTPAPGDFPYRSQLLANLSALILLWESPTLHSLGLGAKATLPPSKRTGIRQVAPGGRSRNSSTASVSCSFKYDVSRARDASEKQARKVTKPDRTASRILCLHASPGARSLRSRQYGI
nr:hypothetical protein [Rathayibacter sp. AY1E2]